MLLVLATLPEWKGNYDLAPIANNSALLFNYIENYLFSLHGDSTSVSILNIVLLVTESLFLNKIVSDHRLMEKPGFVPAMTFLLIQALFPFKIDTFFILINGLLLVLIKLMIIVYKQERPSNNLIGAGFTVGLLATLNSGYWITYFWLITALFIMRPASSKEWLICTIGFLMPFYFILSLEYLNDQLNLKQFFSDFGIVFNTPTYKPIVWVKIGLIVLLPLIGIWTYSPSIGKMVIQNRKTYLSTLILVFVLFGLLAIKFGILGKEIMFLLTPASLLIAPIFLSFKKEFIPNLLVFVLIAIALIR
jgi:hypothetical protein